MHYIISAVNHCSGDPQPNWPWLMLYHRQHHSPSNMKTNLFWRGSEKGTHNNLPDHANKHFHLIEIYRLRIHTHRKTFNTTGFVPSGCARTSPHSSAKLLLHPWDDGTKLYSNHSKVTLPFCQLCEDTLHVSSWLVLPASAPPLTHPSSSKYQALGVTGQCHLILCS